MSAYSDLILSRSPVAYWRLGEASGTAGGGSVIDASGNGHHGTPTGTTFGTPGALAGDADTAASFDGSTSVVTTPSSFGHGSTGGSFSIEFWARPTGTAANMQVIGRFDGTRLLQIGIERPSGTSRVVCAYGVPPFDILGGALAGSAANVALDAWCHVVFTFAAGTGRIYLNGSQIGVDASVTGDFSSATALSIGRRGGDGAEPFAGGIDDVSIYAIALSDAQVLAHYTAGITAPTGSLLLRRRRAG